MLVHLLVYICLCWRTVECIEMFQEHLLTLLRSFSLRSKILKWDYNEMLKMPKYKHWSCHILSVYKIMYSGSLFWFELVFCLVGCLVWFLVHLINKSSTTVTLWGKNKLFFCVCVKLLTCLCVVRQSIKTSWSVHGQVFSAALLRMRNALNLTG